MMNNGIPRILIADDDRQIRLLAGEVLTQGGFSVTEASNGEEALQQVASVGCDLILLDVVMPKLDGFATCARVRQMPIGTRLPIVMMTGCDDAVSIQRAFEVGATDSSPSRFSGPFSPSGCVISCGPTQLCRSWPGAASFSGC
ncbi:MAG: response regulator [Synechococcaceae cyanobacterium SM1_2_3]|nr:response regulator [Synechococcaceae cyanobacterium SM1_2_3]